ncbi:hypothetical protein GQ600_16683 [Phytophthora cactorum]|nr:hypothetical protein GQ600_16683 [Phytophthora cactorum]
MLGKAQAHSDRKLCPILLIPSRFAVDPLTYFTELKYEQPMLVLEQKSASARDTSCATAVRYRPHSPSCRVADRSAGELHRMSHRFPIQEAVFPPLQLSESAKDKFVNTALMQLTRALRDYDKYQKWQASRPRVFGISSIRLCGSPLRRANSSQFTVEFLRTTQLSRHRQEAQGGEHVVGR